MINDFDLWTMKKIIQNEIRQPYFIKNDISIGGFSLSYKLGFH